MKPETVRKLGAIVKLASLVVAGIAVLVLEHRQSTFGETYATELQKIRSELRLDAVDFGDERSYVVFKVSQSSISDASFDEYLKSLATDVRKVYCSQIASTKDDLKFTLFHVNVRAVSHSESKIIFSHALTRNSCT